MAQFFPVWKIARARGVANLFLTAGSGQYCLGGGEYLLSGGQRGEGMVIYKKRTAPSRRRFFLIRKQGADISSAWAGF
ncbi:hypothetical protein CXT84_04085 [Akkermansia muciniphila]|nr:hypothetical protein [Akkermansia muciniphila]PND03343.1 hypothetical protein CXT86_10225 [Akkermansia muciniphila]PND15174.1 hypothetical protein CXT84_04085 [Akkermansia muciniphila]